ncbi:MAG: hypothetical protein H0V22_02530 [Solirubrobacterales bacterium]|jgi:hypothetical protein|nr:hypothetical protein [Solirubrobacterales bacterium]
MGKRAALAAGVAVVVIGAAGCGAASSSGGSQASKPSAANAPEVNPAGDIPDDQAYVAYATPGGGFTVKVPEGWSRSAAGGAVVFTDKLNTIRVETTAAQTPLTARDARQTEFPKLASSVSGFRPGTVTTVGRKAGTAVRITYSAKAKPDPVTGKTGRDAVERYVFFHNGKDVILTLSGPKGADNVDPWKIVTDSVTWSR